MQQNTGDETFWMEYRHSKGNLHIQARGVFDAGSAGALLGLLQEQYAGSGRIFVDTTRLQEVQTQARTVFHCGFTGAAVPVQQLFFKGEMGFSLAPDGSRVLVVAAKKDKGECCGRCAVCHCGKQRRQEEVA